MGEHRVTFADNKIGRHKTVEPIDIKVSGTFNQRLDDAAELIYRHALKHLSSRDVDVFVGSTDGEVMVGCFRRVAVFTIVPAIEQVTA